jgi:AraC-like DNA-binding protein
VPNNHSVDSHSKTTNEENITLPVNWRDEKSVACVEKKLRDATRADPPTSLTKLAKEIKCTKSTLRKKFPELAAQIAKRADTYYRPRLSNQEILLELSAALREHPPPPLQEISRRLGAGASATTLHKKFPEESRMIVERYCAHSKRRLDNNVIEKRLRAFLERVPAPSMPEVAHEMGISRATLHQKFPVLYKALSNRFAEYRREKNRLNRERVKAEIKSICERAFEEGIYPDSLWVRSRLTVPCQAEVFSKIRRDVLAEMGDTL